MEVVGGWGGGGGGGGGCFFFQAEDGIRDAQESRGLGDVYKRQIICRENQFKNIKAVIEESVFGPEFFDISTDYNNHGVSFVPDIKAETVSYTHLTLPTIYSV